MGKIKRKIKHIEIYFFTGIVAYFGKIAFPKIYNIHLKKKKL